MHLNTVHTTVVLPFKNSKRNTGIIINKIKPYLRDIIGDYQCSLMSGRSTIDHIFTVKQLIEKRYEFNKDLHMLFINYKQAYDTVNRKTLWSALITFGVQTKIVRMIKLSMNKTRCKSNSINTCEMNLKSKPDFDREIQTLIKH